MATKTVVLQRSGAQTAHLRVRGVRAGRYRLEVATGKSVATLTRSVSASVTLAR